MRKRIVFALVLAVLLSIASFAYAADLYFVASTQPTGYCYMYDHASSSGSISKNLGRYNDGSVIEVLDWYADKNYAYVRGSDGKVGYINKDYLIR